VEAKIDLTGLNRAKQNIFSLGSNISVWSTGNDNHYNLHFYYPNSEAHDHLLRFSAVIGNKVNDLTRRTKGIIKLPVKSEDDEIITIKIDREGIQIDGHYIENYQPGVSYDGKNTTAFRNAISALAEDENADYKYIPEDDRPLDTYQYLISNYFENVNNIENLQFGSMEGSTRTWAYYEYIKYHKNL